ncbi:MAG TPA: BsuPI-related putative proteinase inhibitor [Longimicrobiales bacterium]|nr:BsuPI-related putative proteinase inhibitor [Longimicrobiales bacterium]
MSGRGVLLGRGILPGLLLVVGCAGTNGDRPAGEMVGDEVAASVGASVGADSVLLRLHVTNTTDGSLSFTFPSSQRYDFRVADSSGESVWQWSAARSFAQVIAEVTLAPGETWEFDAAWRPESPGQYTATGWITDRAGVIRQSATFEVQ